MYLLLAREETIKDELYETLLSENCVYQERHGTQRPGWFDRDSNKRLSFEEYLQLDDTFDWNPESLQWKAIKRECLSCIQNAVVFNISSMGKFLIKGDDALNAMELLCPNNISVMNDGSSICTYFLNSKGGIEADVTINRIDANEFYITCSDIATNHVFAHLCHNINDKGFNVIINDLTNCVGTISIQGPKSIPLLEKSFGLNLRNFQPLSHKQINLQVS